MSTLVVKTVPGDGDCLFHSIKDAVASVGYHYSVAQLRAAVAKRALNPYDVEFNEILGTWCEIAQAGGIEFSMAMEMAHIWPYKNIPISSWTPAIRTDVYTRMMSPVYYWGNEVALQTLERALQIKFLVWHAGRKAAMQPVTSTETFHNKDGTPIAYNLYVILQFSDCDNGAGGHYDLIGTRAPNGKVTYVFAIEELPTIMRKKFAPFL